MSKSTGICFFLSWTILKIINRARKSHEFCIYLIIKYYIRQLLLYTIIIVIIINYYYYYYYYYFYHHHHHHPGTEITPECQWQLALGEQKFGKLRFFFARMESENLILICTLKKCLVCFWLKLSSDFAVMSEENDM